MRISTSSAVESGNRLRPAATNNINDAPAVRRWLQPRFRAVEAAPRRSISATQGAPRAPKSVPIMSASVQRLRCFPCRAASRTMRPPRSTRRMPSSMSSIDGRGNIFSSNPPTAMNSARWTAPRPAQKVEAGPAAIWCTWWWRRFLKSETTPPGLGALSYEPNTAVKDGSAANAARIRSKASACTATSESTKTTMSPVARPTPIFLASAGPALSGSRRRSARLGAGLRPYRTNAFLESSPVCLSPVRQRKARSPPEFYEP